jgi:hypothetical protein
MERQIILEDIYKDIYGTDVHNIRVEYLELDDVNKFGLKENK